VGKTSLRTAKPMKAAAYVTEAQEWANRLVRWEARGPGDLENAMRRLETKYGVDFNALWSLRYRPPKRIFVDLYEHLRAVHDMERQRQRRLLEDEISTAEGSRPNHVATRAAHFAAFRPEGEAE
jgi:hypothetical protein